MRKLLTDVWHNSLAYYDPNKDEIFNAEPGTFVYQHELGHRRQLPLMKKWSFYEQSLLTFSIVTLAFGGQWIASVLMSIWLLYVLYLEVDAYAYAFRTFGKPKGNDPAVQ